MSWISLINSRRRYFCRFSFHKHRHTKNANVRRMNGRDFEIENKMQSRNRENICYVLLLYLIVIRDAQQKIKLEAGNVLKCACVCAYVLKKPRNEKKTLNEVHVLRRPLNSWKCLILRQIQNMQVKIKEKLSKIISFLAFDSFRLCCSIQYF